MNIDKLIEKLLEVARSDRSEAEIPFGFEKRVMARIASLGVVDPWSVRTLFLWRAAASCTGVMVVLAALAWTTHVTGLSTQSLDLELENTVYAVVDSVDIW